MPFDIAPTRIDATEARLGVRLPVAYRDAMARANGGTVEVDGQTWWLHPILDDSDARRLKRTANDVVHETLEVRTWPSFPSTGVAIAHDGSANHLVLMPDAEDGTRLGDAVYRWDHEAQNLERVAEGFEELRRSRG